MIKTGFAFIASIFVILSVYNIFFAKYGDKKVFKVIPPIVILYLFIMGAGTLGLWDYSDGSAVLAAKSNIMNFGVPILIYLACVSNDIRKTKKLGKKLIGVYVATALTIMIGIFVGAILFSGKLNIPEAGNTFGAFSASFIGGPENLYAVANTVKLSDAALANALMLIYVVFTPWMLLLTAVVPIVAPRFNKWTKTNDLTIIAEAAERIDEGDTTEKREATATDVFVLFAVGGLIEAIGLWIGRIISSTFPAFSMWGSIIMYVIVTVVSLLLGCYSKLPKNPALKFATPLFATVMLFLGAVGVDLRIFMNAGWFLATSATALVIHTALMFLYAKLTRSDMYAMGCASIACVGGNSSAAVVAAAYGHKAYITIATVMAAVGPVVGTFLGLGLAQLLNGIL